MKRFLLILCAALSFSGVLYAAPRHVEVVKSDNGGWQFTVDGKPFFMNAATVYASQPFCIQPADFGANSIRIFRFDKNPQYLLDRAEDAGLMIHVGLGFRQVRSGYYDKDEEGAIDKQEREILNIVSKFKNHPAVLCWCIGNEFEINHQNKPLTAQYESIQRIAEKIHEMDPHHPVTLAVTAAMPEPKRYGLEEICTDLDFLSVNTYLTINNEPKASENLTAAGWTKGFVCTEFGPAGWWNHDKFPERRYTSWGAVIDLTSSEKEALYEKNLKSLLADPRCMGTSVFLWGNQTSNLDEVKEWYGIVDKNGYTYGVVDVMQRYWTGHAPVVKAPRIESRADVTMNGKQASDWIKVKPGSENTAAVKASTTSGQTLRYHWRIVKERAVSYDRKLPDGISGLIYNDGGASVRFVAPYTPGAYRLFIHVYDDVNRKAAYAGIPFLVEGEEVNLEKLEALE